MSKVSNSESQSAYYDIDIAIMIIRISCNVDFWIKSTT